MVTEKDLKESITFMKKEIKGLARASYIFETVVVPRAEADKKVLAEMSEQVKKIEAMVTQLSAGGELTPEEIASAIPPQFR